jgi:hypothetical protein
VVVVDMAAVADMVVADSAAGSVAWPLIAKKLAPLGAGQVLSVLPDMCRSILSLTSLERCSLLERWLRRGGGGNLDHPGLSGREVDRAVKKNRKREFCTSGSVRDEGGNILIYSATQWDGGVADGGACAAGGKPGYSSPEVKIGHHRPSY